MTLEEAKKLNIEITKNAIKARLYRCNPVKYVKYKSSLKQSITPHDILKIFDMTRVLADHKRGHSLFEMDDKFYKSIERFRKK